MKLAAIDIGSNAIRLQITNVIEYNGKTNFKKVEYVRFPLRLGHDVFNLRMIGPEREEKFVKLMKAFKLLIDLYEIDEYMACATSAMRESSNGRAIVDRVYRECELKIDIIDGEQEAEMTNKAIYKFLDEKTYLHIDVGGGSTELNLYQNKQKMASQSFELGSVRRMEKLDSPKTWKLIEKWIVENVPLRSKPIAVGTGGNMNKLYDLSKVKKTRLVNLAEIQEVTAFIKKHDMAARINELQLNPDRADVIIPASEIYVTIMKWANCQRILVPDVGLKDGMMEIMYERFVASGILK